MHEQLNEIEFYSCSRIISNLEENEAKIQTELALQKQFENKIALLSASYVEYLDEDYLFQQMFSQDEGRFLFCFLLCLYYTYNYLNVSLY